MTTIVELSGWYNVYVRERPRDFRGNFPAMYTYGTECKQYLTIRCRGRVCRPKRVRLASADSVGSRECRGTPRTDGDARNGTDPRLPDVVVVVCFTADPRLCETSYAALLRRSLARREFWSSLVARTLLWGSVFPDSRLSYLIFSFRLIEIFPNVPFYCNFIYFANRYPTYLTRDILLE